MTQSFAAKRINDNLVIYETEGGASFKTDISQVNSGDENRNSVWQRGKGRWQLGDRTVLSAEAYNLNKFFRSMKGRWTGFLFKDWLDYQHDDAGGSPTVIAYKLADYGPGYFQLCKSYDNGITAGEQRLIRKPIPSTVKFYLDGVHDPSVDGYVEQVDGVADLTGTAFELIPAYRIKWSGEFDVPVRFDTDEFKARFVSAVVTSPGVDGSPVVPAVLGEKAFYISSLPIVEIRTEDVT